MKYYKIAAAAMCSALIVAACGSDDGAGGDDTAAPTEDTAGEAPAETSGEPDETMVEDTAGGDDASAGDPGMDAALAMVEEFRDPNQPLGVTIPLTEPPPEDVTFAWLECELESCPYITAGIEPAVEALGWELLVISSESANPGPYFQQAIDAGADYIASSGEAPSLYEEQAQAAAAADIKILSAFDTTLPDGPNTNIWTQFGDTSFVEKTGPLMANWAIVDSGGTANVLIVSIPDFPVLKAETDAYIAEMEANCPDCQYTELDITIPQLVGGEVPGAVASALQADESIDYVFFSFGSLPAGVTDALSSANLLEGVTVYGQDFSAFGLEEIVAGTMGAWSADPKAYAGWLMVDAAARLELGMELEEERAAASLPSFLVETPEQAQEILDCCNGDWFVPGMEEQFMALWGVG